MAIIAREPKTDYQLVDQGLHAARCIDVVDLGLVQTEFGDKYQVQLRWVLPADSVTTGHQERAPICARKFTNSLHKKAALRQILEMWRNRPFTPAELEGFDLEKLLGVACQVQIVHSPKADGSVYANVQAVIPLSKGMTAPAAPADYVRVRDREAQRHVTDANKDDDDADIPFAWLLPLLLPMTALLGLLRA